MFLTIPEGILRDLRDLFPMTQMSAKVDYILTRLPLFTSDLL